MKEELIKKLQEISQEEQFYLTNRSGEVKKEIYASGQNFEVDQKLLLKEGKLITVRPHSRFTDFPPHRHNYIEMMYVCKGTITHQIDEQEIVLEPGDLLILNQHVMHSVKRAEYEDIGINFIALPEFFELPSKMLNKENVIAEFLMNILRQNTKVSHYLLFRLQGDHFVENMMENMIASLMSGNTNEDEINQYSMGIVFLYLLNHVDSLTQNSTLDYDEIVVQSTLKYIDTWYKNAQLVKIAEDFNQSLSVLSKLIKQKTGFTFQELLMRKRFQKAVALLLDTDLSVDEIAAAVGYENQSFFYRQFKMRYGITPAKYRKQHRNSKEVHL